MNRLVSALALVSVLAAVSSSPAAAAVRRFAIVAGANRGGDDRAVLKYAVSDAARFAAVMQELGGVETDDAVVLRQPRAGELEASLVTIGDRVRAARRGAAAEPGGAVRTEVFFYYSGHADEKGLLLGNDRLSYETLRDRLDGVPADVRIAVLDACASGAITRMKGVRRKGAFDVDASSNMRGQAFVTSSSADENAQESDRVGGSYFTHYLISGLRGAADATGDGRVTLNEAYQFAFHETLNRTIGTRGGPQHPSYEIDLSGTGDVVLTDLRATSAGLILAEATDGRFFFRDAQRRLVLECYKPQGRRVEVGLEPGVYEVHVERAGGLWRSSFDVKDGGRVALDAGRFVAVTPEATRTRGDASPSTPLLEGRHRLEIHLQFPRSGDSDTVGPTAITNAEWTVAPVGAEYARFVREDLSIGVAVHVVSRQLSEMNGAGYLGFRDTTVAFPVVVEWNPLGAGRARRTVRPYLCAGLGPVVTIVERDVITSPDVNTESRSGVSVGGTLGGRLDYALGRRWTVGLVARWQWADSPADAPDALGRRARFQFGFHAGWLFGSGTTPAR